MTLYNFDMFKKAGIAPHADAVVYGIKHGLLSASDAHDYEEWVMQNQGAEGSPELLVCENRDEALKALDDAGYHDTGVGSAVLRYVALASLKSSGQELLSDIESIYADFGYPRDMEPFIYYMPSDSDATSPEDLVAHFHKFLASEKRRLDL